MQVSSEAAAQESTIKQLRRKYLHQSFTCFSVEQADEQNLVLSEKARLHLEKYSFPVEMMVALPNGTVVNILLFLSLLKDMKQSTRVDRSCAELHHVT